MKYDGKKKKKENSTNSPRVKLKKKKKTERKYRKVKGIKNGICMLWYIRSLHVSWLTSHFRDFEEKSLPFDLCCIVSSWEWKVQKASVGFSVYARISRNFMPFFIKYILFHSHFDNLMNIYNKVYRERDKFLHTYILKLTKDCKA